MFSNIEEILGKWLLFIYYILYTSNVWFLQYFPRNNAEKWTEVLPYYLLYVFQRSDVW